MAQRRRTPGSRIALLCVWPVVLLAGVMEIARVHSNVRFLSLFQMAVALMLILREIREWTEEPS